MQLVAHALFVFMMQSTRPPSSDYSKADKSRRHPSSSIIIASGNTIWILFVCVCVVGFECSFVPLWLAFVINTVGKVRMCNDFVCLRGGFCTGTFLFLDGLMACGSFFLLMLSFFPLKVFTCMKQCVHAVWNGRCHVAGVRVKRLICIVVLWNVRTFSLGNLIYYTSALGRFYFFNLLGRGIF